MSDVFLIIDCPGHQSNVLAAYTKIERATDAIAQIAATRPDYTLINDESLGLVVYGVEENEWSIGDYICVQKITLHSS